MAATNSIFAPKTGIMSSSQQVVNVPPANTDTATDNTTAGTIVTPPTKIVAMDDSKPKA
jgi:hypothetical protein